MWNNFGKSLRERAEKFGRMMADEEDDTPKEQIDNPFQGRDKRHTAPAVVPSQQLQQTQQQTRQGTRRWPPVDSAGSDNNTTTTQQPARPPLKRWSKYDGTSNPATPTDGGSLSPQLKDQTSQPRSPLLRDTKTTATSSSTSGSGNNRSPGVRDIAPISTTTARRGSETMDGLPTPPLTSKEPPSAPPPPPPPARDAPLLPMEEFKLKVAAKKAAAAEKAKAEAEGRKNEKYVLDITRSIQIFLYIHEHFSRSHIGNICSICCFTKKAFIYNIDINI